MKSQCNLKPTSGDEMTADDEETADTSFGLTDAFNVTTDESDNDQKCVMFEICW